LAELEKELSEIFLQGMALANQRVGCG